ncbi:MAG: CPBP family glutamic-type intramembrane protease [Methanobrevibacter sp.]
MAAIILSSLFFATFHPYEAWLSCFVFAVAMCVAYLISENILVPITLHMLNNLISFSVPYIPNIGAILETDIALAVLAILSVVCLAYISLFIARGYRRINH